MVSPAVILRRFNDTDIGQMIETDNVQKGILLAPEFQHLNRKGKRVGPVVDYFAAPKDTRFLNGSRQLATYNRDIQRIADLEEVCGHRGILLPNDAAIYDAAETDPAKLALWHMPTLPLVNGRNIGGDQVNQNNMYAHKDKGALKGTFTDKAGSASARWYWSATEHRGYPVDSCMAWASRTATVIGVVRTTTFCRPAQSARSFDHRKMSKRAVFA
jgi:hypothetical protein